MQHLIFYLYFYLFFYFTSYPAGLLYSLSFLLTVLPVTCFAASGQLIFPCGITKVSIYARTDARTGSAGFHSKMRPTVAIELYPSQFLPLISPLNSSIRVTVVDWLSCHHFSLNNVVNVSSQPVGSFSHSCFVPLLPTLLIVSFSLSRSLSRSLCPSLSLSFSLSLSLSTL